jgi:hypothetical protein
MTDDPLRQADIQRRLANMATTGPKTEAGRARIAEAQRQRWRLYRERRQGMSLADAAVVKEQDSD